LQGSPSGIAEIVAARCPTRLRHWPRVDSCAADEDGRNWCIGNLFLFCLSAPAVGSNATCKAKKTQQAMVFISLFSFSDPLPVFFLPLSFLFCPSDGRLGG